MAEITSELRRLIAALDAQCTVHPATDWVKRRQTPHDPWGTASHSFSPAATKIFNTPDDGRCYKWSENPEERDMPKIATFDRYELQNLRSKLEMEAQEAREEAMRELIAGYGEDTHPVGAIFKTEKTLRKGEKATPFIFVKINDETWRSTMHGSLGWNALVDYLISEGMPVAATELVALVPAADAELVSNETPAA